MLYNINKWDGLSQNPNKPFGQNSLGELSIARSAAIWRVCGDPTSLLCIKLLYCYYILLCSVISSRGTVEEKGDEREVEPRCYDH
jgi:hypothetical protein